MSEILKPCPFCGGTKICTEKGINLNYCDNCSAESNIEHWNIRPIEDDLRKRIAELEGAYIKADDMLDDVILERAIEIGGLKKRIAELEAFIERLIEAGDAMSNAQSMWVAEEDKWDALAKAWKEREKNG